MKEPQTDTRDTKRKERKLKNYIKDSSAKNRIDFRQIYRRLCWRKLFQNVASHPTTSVDTLFNSMVLDFPSQQPAVKLQLQLQLQYLTTMRFYQCVLPLLFPAFSTFRRLTDQTACKNICRIIFSQPKSPRILGTIVWTMNKHVVSVNSIYLGISAF